MAHAIKRFFEVQGEDPTHHTIFNVIINAIPKVYKAGRGGVPLPEPRLCVTQNIRQMEKRI